MKSRSSFALLALFCCSIPALAQPRVDPRNLHERLLCVVPMVGAGTWDDPKRPLFAPTPRGRPVDPSEPRIIGFSYQLSDNGQLALVEFVALDRKAFAPILNDRRPEIKVFERGKSRREDIEREFRKHKKDIDLDKFEVLLP